jgi:hypothetical protein
MATGHTRTFVSLCGKEDFSPNVRSAMHEASLAHILDCKNIVTEGRSLELSMLIKESMCQYKALQYKKDSGWIPASPGLQIMDSSVI